MSLSRPVGQRSETGGAQAGKDMVVAGGSVVVAEAGPGGGCPDQTPLLVGQNEEVQAVAAVLAGSSSAGRPCLAEMAGGNDVLCPSPPSAAGGTSWSACSPRRPPRLDRALKKAAKQRCDAGRSIHSRSARSGSRVRRSAGRRSRPARWLTVRVDSDKRHW